MDQNPYAAPSLDADVRVAGPADTMPWFPVGTRKLWVMSVLTFGLYFIHWFERQYRFQKYTRGESTWPLARGIGSIFFAHDLFKRVEFAAKGAGISPSWQANSMATLFVVTEIVTRLLGRIPEKLMSATTNTVLTLFTVALVAVIAYPVVQVQGTVNQLLLRVNPGHDKNEGFTVWNWLVIALGVVVLALMVLGMALPETPEGDPPATDVFSQ